MKQIIGIVIILLSCQLAKAQSWKLLADSAEGLAGSKKNSEAILIYDQALKALGNDSAESITTAYINDKIGELEMNSDFRTAAQYFTRALSIKEKKLGSDHPEYAATANNLGNVYNALGLPEKALPLLLIAKATREKYPGKDHPDYASTCDNLGTTYFRLQKFAEAEALLIIARNIREQKLGKGHTDYLNSSINLANVYRGLGRTEESLDLYEEVREQSAKSLGKDNLPYTRSTLNAGIIYFSFGQYDTAFLLLTEVNELVAKNKFNNPLLQGLCFFYLGQINAFQDRYAEAEPLLEDAKLVALKFFNTSHFLYYYSANALGQIYVGLAQFEKAESNLIEARTAIEKVIGKENSDYALSSKGFAQLYFNQGLYDQAAPFAEEAMEISFRVSGANSIDYGEACMVSGILSFNLKEFEKSAELFKTARNAFEKNYGKNNRYYSESSYFLGRTYVKSGQYELAETALLEAKNHAEQSLLGTHNRTYAEICEQFAILYWNKNNRDAAADYFKMESDIQQEAMKKYFLISNESEQYAYTLRLNRFLNLYYSFIHEMPDLNNGAGAYQLSLRNRNIVLNSSRRLRNVVSDSEDPELEKKYEEWMTTRNELASLSAGISKDEIKLLENKAADQEIALARLSSGFQRMNEKGDDDWEAIQKHLKPGEAAIEFIYYRFFNGKNWTDSFRYSAVVLQKDLAPVPVDLFGEKELESLLEQRSIDKASSIDLHYASGKLGKLVWKPLEPYLRSIHTIYYSPAGMLHQISFAALRVNDKQVLSDQYNLEQLFSTSSISTLTEDKLSSSDTMAVYGGILYDADSISMQSAASLYQKGNMASVSRGFNPLGDFRQFPPLPHSATELNEIVRAAQSRKMVALSFSGAAANEESVKSFHGTRSPSVLHFATHGFFFPDPAADSNAEEIGGNAFRRSDDPLFRSGLILAGAENTWKGRKIAGVEDGILTAYEVGNLYLPNTKLLVLSACETGAGEIRDNEGVFGLQRSFKMAGARNLVMSLWEVDDAAALEFMQSFYRSLFDGKGISEAFHLAQSAMKTKYHDKPHLWAGFVLVR